MNKTEYAVKWNATKFTDDNTVAEAREAHKAELALKRWWKNQAVKYLATLTGEDITKKSYREFKFQFDLKPTGTIVIKEYAVAENGVSYSIAEQFLKEYRVPKSKILTPTTKREREINKEIADLTSKLNSIHSLIYIVQQDRYNNNRRRISGLYIQAKNVSKKVEVLQEEKNTLKG